MKIAGWTVRLVKGLLLGALSWGLNGAVLGQPAQVTTITTFNGTNGAFPAASLTLGNDGNFYGTTYYGSTNNFGTVFKVTPAGTLTSLVLFSNTNGQAIGAHPLAPLTLAPDGTLYGTTIAGGTNGSGTIFKVTTNGTFTSLFSFDPEASKGSPNGNGAEPGCGLTLGSDGNFYGLTIYGGTNGQGTFFKMTTNGTLTSLYSFDPLAARGNTNGNGAEPSSCVLTPGSGGGVFYGTARYGGSGGVGTVFRIDTNGTLKTLFSFSPVVSDGSTNHGSLYTNAEGAELSEDGLAPGIDGNFYGTAQFGGRGGAGTIFVFTTNGTLLPIYSFDPSVFDGDRDIYTNVPGSQPVGTLTRGPDGAFYGAASNGGNGGMGTFFRVSTNGTFTLLFSFSPLSNGTNTTGGEPLGLTPGKDGNYYTTTYEGGIYGGGSIVKMVVGDSLKILLGSGKTILTWSNSSFSLQSAPIVAGPYVTIPAATSPYTNSPVIEQQFFRLILN